MLTCFQFTLKYKLYALVLLAFVLGLLRWKNTSVDAAVLKLKEAQTREREAALKVQRGIRDDVGALDDAKLSDRAARWVRNRHD